MGSDFRVDADELRRLALTCYRLAGEIDEGRLPRDAIDGVAGSRHVEDAYGGFVSHWSDGLWKIRHHLQELGERLDSAATAYLQTEGAISTAACDGRSRGGSR